MINAQGKIGSQCSVEHLHRYLLAAYPEDYPDATALDEAIETLIAIQHIRKSSENGKDKLQLTRPVIDTPSWEKRAKRKTARN